MSIDWDYFSLSFSSSKDNLVRWRVETNMVISLFWSKTQRLSTETTLVSPFRHPETIKSDDAQRPTWSFALLVEDYTSINRDYFSLPFVNQRQVSSLTHRDQRGHIPFSSKTQHLSVETTLVSIFSIQRQSSLMACEDRDGHSLSLLWDYQSPLIIQRQASPIVCGDDDGHRFLIFFEIVVVPFAI